jgi:alanyl-tRNA synthetase
LTISQESTRLYYTDAYVTSFEAEIVDRLNWQGRPAVVLDRTAFYPTSGGQPFDTGEIGGARVIDVADADDGRIVHVIEGGEGNRPDVRCRVDWARRFDHMQQHTGQHVLSAAFERTAGIRTESFHLGTETCTIDVSATVSSEAAAAAEREANRVVWQNLPVTVRFIDEADVPRLALRKPPPSRSGVLRVIEIEGVDLSACGGTHVARTGEIGLVGIVSFERYKGGTRVEFVCGGRALSRFRQAHDALAASARQLGCAHGDVPAGLDRLQTESKQQRNALREAQQEVSELRGAQLRQLAVRRGNLSVVARHLAGLDAAALKALAAAVASEPGHVAIVCAGDPVNVVVARGPAGEVDSSAVIRALIARFGGRGGGRAELAQAGGLSGPPDEILAAAVDQLPG